MRRITHVFLLLTLAATLGYAKDDKKANRITNGPVIESVFADKAVIAWSTSEKSSTSLFYGTDKNNLNERVQAPWGQSPHRVTVTGLKPSTTYYFRIDSGQAQGTGTDATSEVYSLTTVAKGAGPDRANRNVGVQGGPGYDRDVDRAGGNSDSSANSSNNADKVPLYRFVNSSTKAHAFATSEAAPSGFQQEGGIVGYLSRTQSSGTVPFYALSSGTDDRLYTTDASERANVLAGKGYHDDGILGYLLSSPQAGTQPLYRAVNTQNGQHLYTTSQSERTQTMFRDEGIAGYIWTSK